MNRIRLALSQIGEVFVLYLRLLALTIVIYVVIYGYLWYTDGQSITDVGNNGTASQPVAARSDL